MTSNKFDPGQICVFVDLCMRTPCHRFGKGIEGMMVTRILASGSLGDFCKEMTITRPEATQEVERREPLGILLPAAFFGGRFNTRHWSRRTGGDHTASHGGAEKATQA